MTPASLLILTFAIGIGSAMTGPAWGAIVPELVPREDLVQAIALNGIGFNIARALGPALAGFLVVLAGSGFAFALFAVSILAVVGALLSWRRTRSRSALPREHLMSAIRAGMRFVANTPAMRATMVRSFAYALPSAAPWAVLPLVVREQLHLGAGMYGLILGLMGVGGVTSGLLLPNVRHYANRSTIVFASSLCPAPAWRCWRCRGTGCWRRSAWRCSASAGLPPSPRCRRRRSLSAPPWVRARALAIYQMSYNGALAFGSFGWGWLGDADRAIRDAAGRGERRRHRGRRGARFSASTRRRPALPTAAISQPPPEAPDAELAAVLPHARGPVAGDHALPRDRGAAG